MANLPLTNRVVDAGVRERNLERLRSTGAVLPTFAELASPDTIPESIHEELRSVDPDAPHPLNLFRVHWFNARDRRGFAAVPDHTHGLRGRGGCGLRAAEAERWRRHRRPPHRR